MNTKFTDWLDQELKNRGWTRADLARRASISQSYLSMMWTGTRSPSAEVCKGIARALGYPQEIVFRKAGLLDDPPPPGRDPDIQLAIHLLANLPPEARKEALEYIQFKAQKAQQSRKHPALER